MPSTCISRDAVTPGVLRKNRNEDRSAGGELPNCRNVRLPTTLELDMDGMIFIVLCYLDFAVINETSLPVYLHY